MRSNGQREKATGNAHFLRHGDDEGVRPGSSDQREGVTGRSAGIGGWRQRQAEREAGQENQTSVTSQGQKDQTSVTSLGREDQTSVTSPGRED